MDSYLSWACRRWTMTNWLLVSASSIKENPTGFYLECYPLTLACWEKPLVMKSKINSLDNTPSELFLSTLWNISLCFKDVIDTCCYISYCFYWSWEIEYKNQQKSANTKNRCCSVQLPTTELSDHLNNFNSSINLSGVVIFIPTHS